MTWQTKPVRIGQTLGGKNMINRRIRALGTGIGGIFIFAILGFDQAVQNKSQQTPTPDFVATQFAVTLAVPQDCPAASAIYAKVNEIEMANPEKAAEYLTELIDRCPEEYEALWRRAVVLKNSGYMYGALTDLELLLAHVEANPDRSWGFGITYERVEQMLHQVKANLGK
jgi:hypothetical protein